MRPRRMADYYGVGAVPGFLARLSDSNRPHLPELTGLRGVAILIVVIGHLLQRVERFYGREALNHVETLIIGILATPFSGCRLLFCITGYTLAVYLAKNVDSARSISNIELIKNRLTRIWPPYAIVLISTLIFITTTGYEPTNVYQYYSEPKSILFSFIVSIVYLHDLLFNTFPRLFPPGWYLESYVQFLTVGPFIWSYYLKFIPRKKKLAAVFSVLILSIILSTIVSEHGSRGLQYSLVAFLPYFLVGAILADLRTHDRYQHIAGILVEKWPVGLLGLVALIVLGAPCGAIWWQLPAQLVAIAAIVTACLTGRSRFRNAMSGRHLIRIGIASFSIYLIHLQILQVSVPIVVAFLQGHSFVFISAVCAAVGLCLVLGLALAFYWLVERPCVAFSLHMKQTFPCEARLA